MSIADTQAVRRYLGYAAMGLFAICLVTLADGLIGQFKRDYNALEALPGSSQPLTGPMPPKAQALKEVAIEGNQGPVRLVFTERLTGYWLGTDMWRGTIKIDPSAPPGEYVLKVRDQGLEPQSPLLVFKVRVRRDEQDMQLSSPSLIKKHLGIQPFVLAAGMFALGAVISGAAFLMARTLERQMKLEGQAEIYMVKKGPEGLAVTFSLGSEDGVTPGLDLLIRNEAGMTVGTAKVVSCTAQDATATVQAGGNVHLGDIADIKKPQSYKDDSVS